LLPQAGDLDEDSGSNLDEDSGSNGSTKYSAAWRHRAREWEDEYSGNDDEEQFHAAAQRVDELEGKKAALEQRVQELERQLE
jgi:hypothetical protein